MAPHRPGGAQAQAAGQFWGMERQPGVGEILGVHTREALHHCKKLLSRTQPNSTVPSRPPGSACTLTPTWHFTLAGLRKWKQKGATEAPEPTSLALPLPGIGNASGLPHHHPTTPAFLQVSRCPTVSGEDRPLQSTGDPLPS